MPCSVLNVTDTPRVRNLKLLHLRSEFVFGPPQAVAVRREATTDRRVARLERSVLLGGNILLWTRRIIL